MATSVSGSFHRFCKSAKSAGRQREKRWNVCKVLVLHHIYSKISGVRLQVCSVNKNKNFDVYQTLSSIRSLLLKALSFHFYLLAKLLLTGKIAATKLQVT